MPDVKRKSKKKRLNGFQKEAQRSWKAYLHRGKEPINKKKEKVNAIGGCGNN